VRRYLPNTSARASLVLALTALVFALAPTPAAVAAGFEGNGALGRLQEGAAEEPTTSTATTSGSRTETETTTHNTGSTLPIVLAIAGVLLAGVVFVIMRDVRKWAPAGDSELVEATVSRRSQVALQRRRAKAKAARRQRKRNR
jgi:uncharacterized protein HemX